MSQRAALYTVAVRPRSGRGATLPLGNLDGSGAHLVDVLAGLLDGFSSASADGSTVVRTLTAERDGEDLFAVLQHGRRGTAADILDPAGALRLRLRPDDLQLVRSGCLFQLPAAATEGRLAVQVVNGRGTKELLVQGLATRFGARFPSLTLEIQRAAEPRALRDAVEQEGITRLRLARREAGNGSGAKWAAAGAARVQLEVTAGSGLKRDLVSRYLAGDAEAFAEIVRFGGMRFDRAWVEVALPDGAHRLFDLAHPDRSPPMTKELHGLELDVDGEPTDASLRAALSGLVGAGGA